MTDAAEDASIAIRTSPDGCHITIIIQSRPHLEDRELLPTVGRFVASVIDILQQPSTPRASQKPSASKKSARAGV